MAIKGQAWKTTVEKNASECVYRIQVTGIKGVREEARVDKVMSDWEQAGDGYNRKTNETTFFFRKDFKSVENFISWGKAFKEFPLIEVDKNGNVKKYVKIGPKSASGGSQRICGKCGTPGHNARTCGVNRVVKSTKAGTRQCGKCGERGHNARTCKSSVAIAKVSAKKPNRGRQCGNCGEYGHNKRTCLSK